MISVGGLLAASIIVLWNQLIHTTHFKLVSLDTGQKTFGKGKKVYFVVAIDHFTRWVEAQVLHEKNSKSIMEFIMNSILFRHGCPARIQTDRGLPYVSEAKRHFF